MFYIMYLIYVYILLSSPFLFVNDNDRVICYTGADRVTGDAEGAKETK